MPRHADALARADRQSPTALRRSDRGADDAWIRERLRTAAVGTLATARDGRPFLNTNLFVYEDDEGDGLGTIWLHTAHVGRTAANVALFAPAPVCFSVFEIGRLLPDDRALEFSVEYAGVVAFGSGWVVERADEQRHGLALVMAKYAAHLAPGADYEPPTDADLARTAVFRIDVEAWSGKTKAAPADFPGAYTWPDVGAPAP
ncbi:pyridoxamine 5'-phosphate oxidase family protein [Rubrivirga sp.]|uniref:pyridoxamine 5'-phosphate oxidase family protein n=1 Tax=Rubrivirga sp. TaxID=1885344 RepID=UPI003B519D3B